MPVCTSGICCVITSLLLFFVTALLCLLTAACWLHVSCNYVGQLTRAVSEIYPVFLFSLPLLPPLALSAHL